MKKILLCGALIFSCSAFAQDATGSNPQWEQKMQERKEFCQTHQAECQQERAERKAKFEQMCQSNPQECAEKKQEWQQRREERKEACAANPSNCQRPQGAAGTAE